MSLIVSGDRALGDGGLRRSSLPSGDAEPPQRPLPTGTTPAWFWEVPCGHNGWGPCFFRDDHVERKAHADTRALTVAARRSATGAPATGCGARSPGPVR